MSYAKKLIVPVLCVLLGCAGGAAMGSVTAQQWPENPRAPRWQHQCVGVGTGRSGQQELATAMQMGNGGWEMVGFAVFNGYSQYCFKRPAP